MRSWCFFPVLGRSWSQETCLFKFKTKKRKSVCFVCSFIFLAVVWEREKKENLVFLGISDSFVESCCNYCVILLFFMQKGNVSRELRNQKKRKEKKRKEKEKEKKRKEKKRKKKKKNLYLGCLQF